jgi:hypothetical protein
METGSELSKVTSLWLPLSHFYLFRTVLTTDCCYIHFTKDIIRRSRIAIYLWNVWSISCCCTSIIHHGQCVSRNASRTTS